MICYGNDARPTTAKGITISNAQYAIGKYWETSTHNVGIISSSGSAAPKIVDNGFEVKHTDGYATLNVPDITYHWVAIG